MAEIDIETCGQYGSAMKITGSFKDSVVLLFHGSRA
jgi:hypothetical protein